MVDFITADSPADKSDIRKVRYNQLGFHHIEYPQFGHAVKAGENFLILQSIFFREIF